ncbi:MAG TPA: hypothetical protein ENF26_05835 [Methanomicrobia archaeon]|nr:Predictednucleic acid-binding protein [Candidatus Alkanophaga volatiphilum]HDO64055.1 hypothetical protein [Methanomicrobia archaeon]HEX59648.1 hypothetical protein [Methanomicrobia archaeon]
MPHKCTRCGKVFEELSDDMLKGCPACGNKLFFYMRSAAAEELAGRIRVEGIEEVEDVGADAENASQTMQMPQLDIESIRILKPGVYVLNLEALFSKEEIIMGIKEDGSYVIHLPSLFKTKRKRKKEK